MALRRGPYKIIYFIVPEELRFDEKYEGEILIDDISLSLKPKSLYHYLIIQIVAELQSCDEFKKGVPPEIVLHYLREINHRLGVLEKKKIHKLDSLKYAWRNHIRKGESGSVRLYKHGKLYQLNKNDRFVFLQNFFMLPLLGKNKKGFFKLNIENQSNLIVQSAIIKGLKKHHQKNKTPKTVLFTSKENKDNISIQGKPYLKDYLNQVAEIHRYFDTKGLPLKSLDDFADLVRLYAQREEYNNLSDNEFRNIFYKSLTKDVPLLYWCKKLPKKVIEILSQLLDNKSFLHREKAFKLYLYLCEENPYIVYHRLGNQCGSAFDEVLTTIVMNYDNMGRLPFNLEEIPTIEYLAEYGNLLSFEKIKDYANSTDKYVRRALAFSLRRFRIFPAVDLLLGLLNDEDFGVQSEALWSLGRLCGGKKDNGRWIFSLIKEYNEKILGRFLDIKLPLHEEDSLIKTVSQDHLYSQVFPEKVNNRKYLIDIIKQTDFNQNRWIEERLSCLGMIGDESELKHLLLNYSLFLESRNIDFYRNYIEAINTIDERLYGKIVYRKHLRNSPLVNRWWWQGGFIGIGIGNLSMVENELDP